MKRLLTGVLVLVVSAGCSEAPPPSDPSAGRPFDTDVPGIRAEHLSADFWLAQTREPDAVLMSAEEVRAFNNRAFDVDPTLVRIESLPPALDREALLSKVRAISSPSSYDRWTADGRQVTADDWAGFDALLDLDAVADDNPLRYGMVVRRASMRTYPTNLSLYNTPEPSDIDRFQENGLFPGDAVAIYHTSRDGDWLLVQTYNYLAWAPADAIAIGERDEILGFGSRSPRLVVTGDKVFTNFNPSLPATSEVQLDMGVSLPLLGRDDVGDSLRGQNPYTSHIVSMPVRSDHGTLAFEAALIARSEDVSLGPLPFTRGHVIKQSFKFLGERYGWGHDYNARDCTGFVSEVYRTFGFTLPRNSGDQRDSAIGINLRFDETAGRESRMEALRSMDTGDLVYIPGHVMLSLGNADGQPYVIHDVNGLQFTKADGSFYQGTLNTVAVTPIEPLQSDAGDDYVDRMLNIKSIRHVSK
ncbi:MAG: SH3 domain-containing protein [Woeseiaceae bacterium]|nr:SH3 domain-containing protein [Woeseiaceae bacterium]